MGRSAKVAKRPTKKQKAASKIARAASKPLPPPPPRAVKDDGDAGLSGPKKRKMMRAKVDKVGGHAGWWLNANTKNVQKLGKS